jgi:hypothetical protein
LTCDAAHIEPLTPIDQPLDKLEDLTRTKMTTIGKTETKTDQDEYNGQEDLRNIDDEQEVDDEEILEEEGFGEL